MGICCMTRFSAFWLRSSVVSVLISIISDTSSIRRRRQWHPTPVLWPGKSHGRRSLVGCSPWGLEESDTTERLHFHFHFQRLQTGPQWQPRGVRWRGKRGEFQEGGDMFILWLIHVDVWQKPAQYCKATILLIKRNKFLKIHKKPQKNNFHIIAGWYIFVYKLIICTKCVSKNCLRMDVDFE